MNDALSPACIDLNPDSPISTGTDDGLHAMPADPAVDHHQSTIALHSIVMPVLDEMPVSHLKHELIGAFLRRRHQFAEIEDGFRRLTAHRQDRETLRGFFQSWSQTNNSAMTVAGIGNRMTLLLHRRQAVADRDALLRALVSLGRIVDEDLAVTHKVLHSQLFYTMATEIVGDDQWLSQRYIGAEARAFKVWKDQQSLRDPDLLIALLTTLAHEIYTHGEVEFILPLFRRWLREDYGFSERDCTRVLGWISVHCGPTEKNHFFHALDAVGHYADAMQVNIADYRMDEIVGTYLDSKAAVLRGVFPAAIEAAA